jgi:hypothetical protein
VLLVFEADEKHTQRQLLSEVERLPSPHMGQARILAACVVGVQVPEIDHHERTRAITVDALFQLSFLHPESAAQHLVPLDERLDGSLDESG